MSITNNLQGRPEYEDRRKVKSHRVIFRLNDYEYELLQLLCKQNKINKTNIVKKALQHYKELIEKEGVN